MTARIFRGAAGAWVDLEQVWVGEEEPAVRVESARAYRDRLVLKLAGIDDADRAARLRGEALAVSTDQAAAREREDLPSDLLVGLAVLDEAGRRLGRVLGVMATAGVDLLVVGLAGSGNEEDRENEALIPLADEIVLEIDPRGGSIRVRPPAGLLELNRADPAV